MIKAILTKPLDGQPEGTEREFSAHDFERLEKMGAVKAAEEAPDAKAAPAPENKMEAAPANKARAKKDTK
ncbi:MAG: hypothetical protein ACSLE1_02980 [Sphingobium sp.]